GFHGIILHLGGRTTAFTCGPAARNVMSRKTVMPARQVQRLVRGSCTLQHRRVKELTQARRDQPATLAQDRRGIRPDIVVHLVERRVNALVDGNEVWVAAAARIATEVNIPGWQNGETRIALQRLPQDSFGVRYLHPRHTIETWHGIVSLPTKFEAAQR